VVKHSKLYALAAQSVRNAKVALRIEQSLDNNTAAARSLVEMLGIENVVFMHLPQKDEITYGLSSFGRKVREFLTDSRYHWVDGASLCGLTVQDYHEHDGHPNSAGYGKIRECVKSVLTQHAVFR
jgi:hypothetical protein